MLKNKALITAFSLSRDSEKILKRLQRQTGKTKSEIVRNLLSSSTKNAVAAGQSRGPVTFSPTLSPDDTNQILKYYYSLISSQTPKPTWVIGISLLTRSGKVLIGLRKGSDPQVRNLTWTFPTCRFSTLDFERELIRSIKTETGLTAKIRQLVHARLIPDSPSKKVRIVALYYHCRVSSGIPRPGGDFKQLKWVPAADVTKYFTTSTADEIMNFLGTV